MAQQPGPSCSRQPAESELYFLMARFLSNGPCRRSAEMLIQELNENKLLPGRLDWEGNEHHRTYDEMVSVHNCVTPDHLIKLCQNIISILNSHAPGNISNTYSLLGFGRQSTLRTDKGYRRALWCQETFATLHHGRPPEVPLNMTKPPNVVNVYRGNHLTGTTRFTTAFPVTMYRQIKMQKRILGHLSSVYCVAFDRTGQRIFTGSDDCLVKIWSTLDGRLLATLRGHSAEISELTVNYENTLIAASSCEQIIRVWSLRTCSPVGVLQGHSAPVTSLLFSPLVKDTVRYLVSTGRDGTVCLWEWNVDTLVFKDQPLKFNEKSGRGAQMLCCSFSPGGMFMTVGGSDHIIRIYYFGGLAPEKVAHVEGHKNLIDSILFSYNGKRFVTGCEDGTARIWDIQQPTKSIKLDMNLNLDGSYSCDDIPGSKPKVLMIAWNLTDDLVVTASSGHLLKVWDSHTGKLLHVLKGHENDIFVLEPHPSDSRVMLSAGYDGKTFMWDIINGTKVMDSFNAIEGQGHGAILDCKLSADGQHIAGTDSHGHLLIYGFGNSKAYDKIPEQMFFHTDYRPLTRDPQHYVLDEQTQQAPHLMPPPFLVDVEGNPHPPKFQRLVPGRENCTDEHLIPQLGYMETNDGEVVEQVISQQSNHEPSHDSPSVLDGIIRQLQQGQNHSPEPSSSRQPTGADPLRRELLTSPNIGMRRSGQVEGVRQMHQNSPLSQIATERDLLACRRRVVVPELPPNISRKEMDFRIARGADEKALFEFSCSSDPDVYDYLSSQEKSAVHTRSLQCEVVDFSDASSMDQEESESSMDEVENQAENSSYNFTDDEEVEWRNNSSDSSSEYSEWTLDKEVNLQPPRRLSKRYRPRRWVSSTDDESSSGEKSADEKASPPRESPPKRHRDGMTSGSEATPLSREISIDWHPSVWITDTAPHRSPFVPQMGDEVVYFRQGHEAYINAVKRSNLSIVKSLKEPWKKCVLRDQELVKIVGVRYEIGPPTLCCLKLALIDHVSGKLTDQYFSLKYHDMPDVIDFLILRQFYDHACRTNWQAGDKFRSIIDDAWWFGTVLSQEPFQSDYPDSLFQCYIVNWDNAEIERLSPWDMDVIPDDMIPPKELGTSVSITLEEQDTLLYSPQKGEWGNGDQDSECERIICGIDELLNQDMAAPFSAPVDLNVYPDYCKVVAYPTDLGTIRMRLVNRFYRRVSALIWEVRYIQHNAMAFNEPDSHIAKSAKKLTELLVKFIMDSNCTSITDLCNTTEEKDSCDEQSCRDPDVWKKNFMDFVDFIIDCEDSELFREPVDLEQYPDYMNVIKTPMDFGTIKERLAKDEYSNAMDVCQDIRLIFSNAKLYTPNKRSRIYSMVLRLSALVEDKLKVIVLNYKAAQKSRHRGEDPCTTKRLGALEHDEESHCTSFKKVRQLQYSPSYRRDVSQLGESTSSAAGQLRVTSSTASHSRGQLPGTSGPKSRTTKQTRDSSSPSSSSESDSDSDSTTSTSDSTHSSDTSSTSESNDQIDSSPFPRRASDGKAKRFKTTQRIKHEPQDSNQKRSAPSKRKILISSDESDSASSGNNRRKKTLRKCAALAASRIKHMTDVEDSTSDSDCSAGKNTRTLPQRSAATRAKKLLHVGSDEELDLKSDSEQLVVKRMMNDSQTLSKPSRAARRVSSESSAYSSDSSVKLSSPKLPTEDEPSKDPINVEDYSSDEPCALDSPIPPAVTSRKFPDDSDSDSSASGHSIIVLRDQLRKRRSPECRVVLTNVCLTGAGNYFPKSRHKLTPQPALKSDTDSDSEPETLGRSPRGSIVSSVMDYGNCKFSSSDEGSKNRTETSCSDSESSSLSDNSIFVGSKVNGKKPVLRAHEQKRKRALSSSSDEDWDGLKNGTPEKVTRRSKICTRNQGKRTVRYNDDAESSAQSSVKLNSVGLDTTFKRKLRERARQYLR